MKLFALTLIACLCGSFVRSQQNLDTLYANERQVLSLFFESDIEKAITGADHFAFTFNRETGETLGLLQATPGPDSNLLVITEGGTVHNFVLTYRDSLSIFSKVIGLVDESEELELRSKDSEVNSGAIQEICRQMFANEFPYITSKRKRGITLKITSGFYHDNYVYLGYELDNGTAIDYEIDAFTLRKVLGKQSVKSSFQESLLTPVYTYHLPGILPQFSATRFIVVYPKFTFGRSESLKVSLREKHGSRNLDFSIRGL